MNFFPLLKKITIEEVSYEGLDGKYDNCQEEFESWIKTARPGDRFEYLPLEAWGGPGEMTRAYVFLTKGEGNEITGRAESERHEGVDIFRIRYDARRAPFAKGEFLITDLYPAAKADHAGCPDDLAGLRETLRGHQNEPFEDNSLVEVLDWLCGAAYNCLGWGC